MASYAQDDTDDEQQDTKEGRLAHKAPTLQSHDSGIGLGSQETVESQTEGRAPQTLQADAVLLTETALSKLLGIKTATARVRIRDRLVLPLIELAPAVFNIRYLQVCSQRLVHRRLKIPELMLWAGFHKQSSTHSLDSLLLSEPGRRITRSARQASTSWSR
jgi:hypothetical protein